MRFIIDKEQVKKGLIIFRRGDVAHDEFYCRVRIKNEDRYKTISLRTSDRQTARDLALEADSDIRNRLKYDVPVFNRTFAQMAEEYAKTQQRRANVGEVSQARAKNVQNKIDGPLKAYVGSTQIHLIGQDRWAEYPLWRRENGLGRRNGVISDATIRIEMSIFAAIMRYAISKKYVPASNRFEGMPKLKSARRDEFTLEEYRKLHSAGRKWMKEATTPQGVWYRQMCYNFILIMCNTGMRPPEAKNLRWRDITKAKDKDGQEILVIYVHGKGKERNLIAPKSVGDYLDRVRQLSKATNPDDHVFTIINGKPAVWLYRDTVEELLKYANLREGPSGIPRTTYCFRHTYATFRLSAGVDVYILAQQMGTSVKMIEQHYGHVNTIKHADRVLMGIGGWDNMHAEMNAEIDQLEAKAKAIQSIKAKQPAKPPRSKR
ncbi:site-specific integrase [Novosphingobium sp. B1]|uniref:tyrosine-type recombinase/integrase n=1 Tax=Novosphingobium sp. B1 TaxID=1938756 RepID=UPI0009D8CCEA|nr:site-specific integrase [Novosphingobium sp. B1]SMC59277.1 Site-specific recombinase XerD [Novosphingobium sp. B1]